MPTETFQPVNDGVIAVSEFDALSSIDGDFFGSPALHSIRDTLVEGGWQETGKTYAEGTLFVRDLPLGAPLPIEPKVPALECGFAYQVAFAYNGTPLEGTWLVP